MDYLTLALIGLAVLMSIVTLILLYVAKPKDSSSTSRRFITVPGLSRATSDQPTEELYTVSKINSAIGTTIAGIVFGIGGMISASYNKKAALAKRVVGTFRNAGAIPTTVLAS